MSIVKQALPIIWLACAPIALAGPDLCRDVRKESFGRFLLVNAASLPTRHEILQALSDSKKKYRDGLPIAKTVLACVEWRRSWPAAILSIGALSPPNDFAIEDELVRYLEAKDTNALTGTIGVTPVPGDLTYWDIQARLNIPAALVMIIQRRAVPAEKLSSGGQESRPADKALDLLTAISALDDTAVRLMQAAKISDQECRTRSLALRIAAVRALESVVPWSASDISGRLAEVKLKAKDPVIQAEVARALTVETTRP